MREELIRLCSAAKGQLEAHYSDILTALDNPLDHFPYYDNYINLSELKYDLSGRSRGSAGPCGVHRVGIAVVQIALTCDVPPVGHLVREL